MANIRYTAASQAFLTGQLNWTGQNFIAMFVDTTQYTVLPAVHRTLADVPVVARLAVALMSGETAVGGVASAANTVFPITFSQPAGAIIIYQDSGTESTSTLVAYLDTPFGLPVNPQGNTINVAWNTGPLGIFAL
jgi:hypothetical protein